MKNLLLIALLIVGCDNSTEATPTHGCLDSQACNYDATATIDNNSCVYVSDCAGVCGGDAVEDCADVCGGSAVLSGCDNACNSTAIVDAISLCGGSCVADADADGICDDLQGTVTDIDGNIYKTIIIGTQTWMAENLKTTKYKDGSEIPYNDNEWSNLSTGTYAVFPADGITQSIETCDGNCADVYGNLYNWHAVDDVRGVCPDGFRVPSDEEFMELEMELGMSEEDANETGWRGTDEGSKLAGNGDLWKDGDLDNNSEFGISGFTGLPSGYGRGYYGLYNGVREYFPFWSSTEYNSDSAWGRNLGYHRSNIERIREQPGEGYSIRCLKD